MAPPTGAVFPLNVESATVAKPPLHADRGAAAAGVVLEPRALHRERRVEAAGTQLLKDRAAAAESVVVRKDNRIERQLSEVLNRTAGLQPRGDVTVGEGDVFERHIRQNRAAAKDGQNPGCRSGSVESDGVVPIDRDLGDVERMFIGDAIEMLCAPAPPVRTSRYRR